MTERLIYEIRNEGVGLFGEPVYQACTFGIEMRPTPVRRVLGTFSSREDAEKCLAAARAHDHGEP